MLHAENAAVRGKIPSSLEVTWILQQSRLIRLRYRALFLLRNQYKIQVYRSTSIPRQPRLHHQSPHRKRLSSKLSLPSEIIRPINSIQRETSIFHEKWTLMARKRSLRMEDLRAEGNTSAAHFSCLTGETNFSCLPQNAPGFWPTEIRIYYSTRIDPCSRSLPRNKRRTI